MGIMTSEQILAQVLGELECDGVFFDYLKSKRVISMRRLLELEQEDLDEYVADDKILFTKADMRSIITLKKWHEYHAISLGTKPDYEFFEMLDLDDHDFVAYTTSGIIPAPRGSPKHVADVHSSYQGTKRSIGDFKDSKFPGLPIYPQKMKVWKDGL